MALVVWVRENALRHPTAVDIFIEEEFVLVWCSCCRYLEQVEVVIDLLLLQLPVGIVEVVVDPHESLVDHFWHDRLLNSRLSNVAVHWQFDLESSAEPAIIEAGD